MLLRRCLEALQRAEKDEGGLMLIVGSGTRGRGMLLIRGGLVRLG
jgi:hypothetical protein